MDNDSFESFINQSLVDSSEAVSSEMTGADLENELLLQLLLNAVTPTPAPVVTTIDPSSLTTGSGNCDENVLLPSTLFSALPPPPSVSAMPPANNAAAAKPRSPAASTAAANKRAVGGPPPPQAKKPAAAAAGAKSVASGLASPTDELDDFDMEDMEGIDIKSLAPKERRQLRNKISARNFRVRRKEYISNLEAEVRMHKEEADGLRAELVVSRKDNSLLRDEVNKLRQRLAAVAVTKPPPPKSHVAPAITRPSSSSSAAPKAQAQALVAAAPAQQQSPVPPMARFNPHKDIGQAAAKKDGGSWVAKNGRPSGSIAVNTATVSAAHTERLGELVADFQRRRAVEALLNIGDDVSTVAAVQPPSLSTPLPLPAEMIAAAMAVAALVADFVVSQ
ncbi:hypothetical protein IWW38_005217, partial [Coemansia aciculifera]